jgi:hypothetical protein
MDEEIEMILKGSAVGIIDVLSWNLHGNNEEYHKRPQYIVCV